MDNEIAETLGNWPYGYFKQLAAFEEMQTGPTHDLDVVRELAQMFEWQATGSLASLPHAAAMSTLPNYEDAIEIMSMPLLGTLVETGQYVCSYWEWSLTAATAASSDVELKFVQPFRMGMGAWVAQGTVASVPSGAFALQGVAWKLRYPPIGCQF